MTDDTAPLRGIHHITLVTADMDETVRFYHGVLGFPLLAIRRAMGMRWYLFGLGHKDVLAFFETPPNVPAPTGASTHFDHLAFAVDSESDLADLASRVKAAGCEVSEVFDYPLFQSIYFAGPDGLQLEACCWTVDISTGIDLATTQIHDEDPVAAVMELKRHGQLKWTPKTELTADIDLARFADAERNLNSGK